MTYTSPITEIKVGIDFGEDLLPVGRLGMRDRKIYFEYERSFIDKGLNISPLRLPLKTGVTSCDRSLFEGLPGVFSDSLPDGWGRLLFDRFMRSQDIASANITPLDRLAHVGKHGMGALVYEPDHTTHEHDITINLDTLADSSRAVLDGTSDDVLQELLILNGSSAGARPKAMIGIDSQKQHIIHGAGTLAPPYQPWIIKFANTHDGNDAGAIEYVYALMAKEAGITLPEVHLFPANHGAGYFAIKRFDRNNDKRYHMHTAGGLLHSDFRTPSLDYEDLIALTAMLTRDIQEVEKMVQLAVFNVLAHNRDDHAKNFSFLMDSFGEWKLSPAYDLTFSSGPNGEQSTTIMGEGRKPTHAHLIKLGTEAKISKDRMNEIIEHTQAALAQWNALAKFHGVNTKNIEFIAKRINRRERT